MWLKIKARLQCVWAAKSQDEQKQIAIKGISGITAGIISLGVLASSLDLSALYEIVKTHYLPLAIAAVESNRVALMGGLVSTVGSGYLFYQSLISAMSRSQIWFDKPLSLTSFNEHNLSDSDRSSGYQIDRPGLEGRGLVTFSTHVNEAIRAIERLPFDVNSPWKLRGIGRELLPFAIFRASSKGITFDAAKIRLGTDLLLTSGKLPARLTIQKTRYFSGLATNDLSYIEVNSRPAADLHSPLRPLYDGKTLFLESGSPNRPEMLRPLEGSPCSNHIGVSTIAITRDRVVIITGQSKSNIQSRRLLAPSGSGSVDWQDIGKNDDFLEVIRCAAERELIEECGLSSGQYKLKTYVIGFARLVHRGGKPEFFCLTVVEANSGDIELSHSHDEKFFTAFNHADQMYGEIDLTPNKIFSSVENFCAKNKGINSVLLELGLRFMSDAIVENPAITQFPA